MYRTRYDIYFERLFLTGNLFPGKVCVMELILDRFKEFPLLTVARKQMEEGGKRPDRANKKNNPLQENRRERHRKDRKIFLSEQREFYGSAFPREDSRKNRTAPHVSWNCLPSPRDLTTCSPVPGAIL